MSEPIHILYVDDNPLDRELVRDALEKEQGGFRVTEAASHADFEARLSEGDYELVLSDFNILGFEGLQVLDAVHAKNPLLPVVIATGTGSEEVAVEALKRGAADYVIKSPKHIQRLPQTIHAVLEKKRLAEEHELAEVELHESEELFRTMTALSPASIAILKNDEQGERFLYVNAAWETLTGYPRDEAMFLQPNDLIHPDIRAQLAKRASARMRGEDVPSRYEIKIITKSGEIKWLDLAAAIIRYQGTAAILTIGFDITERERTEAALRESESKYRTLVEHIPQKIFTKDRDSVFVSCNENLARDLGIKPEQITGGTDYDFFPSELADKYRADDKRIMETGQTEELEEKYPQAGQEIWVQTIKTPIRQEDGTITGILGIFRDITERKEAERSLLKEKNFSDAVINSSPGLLFIFGEKGNIIRWNNDVEKVTGYSASKIAKMNVLDFIVREDQKSATETIQEVLTKGQASIEINILTKPGKKIPFYIIGKRTKIENITCVVCTGVDISDRKQAEEALQYSYHQLHTMMISAINALASTVEMKDRYTGGHQQRATQLACAIAEEMDLPEEQIEGIRMAGIVHDIGKLMVPAEILNKPGPITELQFDMIKMHPQASYDILKGIKFPWPVAQVVLQHHERMDGSGYPQGLSGEEILLEARILAVANVVEAMTSHRPYRSAKSIEEALEKISEGKGVLYDPKVVDVCIRLFTKKGFIFREGIETVPLR